MNISEKTTGHNVIAFRTAINSGYHPSNYSYYPDDIPTGEYQVLLDFMIWAKNVNGVDLYCTVTQTGQKIRLTVFRDKEENYHLRGLDVRYLPIGSDLAIQVELNGRDKPTLHRVTVLPDISGEHSEPEI